MAGTLSELRQKLKKNLSVAILGVIFCFAGLSGATAQTKLGPILDKKIFNPENGNYYQLVDVRTSKININLTFSRYGVTWGGASRLANQLKYKNVQGRLVKDNSPELDTFLRQTFRPSTYTWIGIRYKCSDRKLYYIDEEPLTPNSFTFWSPVDWSSDRVHNATGRPSNIEKPVCYGRIKYHGAYMTIGDIDRAPYWALVVDDKVWYAFFVEYPTGETENSQVSLNK